MEKQTKWVLKNYQQGKGYDWNILTDETTGIINIYDDWKLAYSEYERLNRNLFIGDSNE